MLAPVIDPECAKLLGEDHRPDYISLDLEASEEQLINDFKAYISNVKKQLPSKSQIRKDISYINNISGPFDESDKQRWRNVLKYLDLEIWREITGAKYSNNYIYDNLGVAKKNRFAKLVERIKEPDYLKKIGYQIQDMISAANIGEQKNLTYIRENRTSGDKCGSRL